LNCAPRSCRLFSSLRSRAASRGGVPILLPPPSGYFRKAQTLQHWGPVIGPLTFPSSRGGSGNSLLSHAPPPLLRGLTNFLKTLLRFSDDAFLCLPHLAGTRPRWNFLLYRRHHLLAWCSYHPLLALLLPIAPPQLSHFRMSWFSFFLENQDMQRSLSSSLRLFSVSPSQCSRNRFLLFPLGPSCASAM